MLVQWIGEKLKDITLDVINGSTEKTTSDIPFGAENAVCTLLLISR